MTSLRLCALLTTALIFASAAYSQGRVITMEKGLELFRTGKFPESVAVFKALSGSQANKENAEVWNYLGLAQSKAGDAKGGRKSFEKAVKLQPANADYRTNFAFALLVTSDVDRSQREAREAIKLDPKSAGAHYILGTGYLWEGKLDESGQIADQIIALDPAFPQGYMLRYDTLIGGIGRGKPEPVRLSNEMRVFDQAVTILEAGLAKSQKHPMASVLAENLEDARAFQRHFAKRRSDLAVEANAIWAAGGAQPDSSSVTPFRVIEKPKAAYTDAARNRLVSGTIRLAVLLRSDGKIGGIIKLSSLGYGLDEHALRAARAIKFEPKKIDGKPADSVVTIEYTFTIR